MKNPLKGKQLFKRGGNGSAPAVGAVSSSVAVADEPAMPRSRRQPAATDSDASASAVLSGRAYSGRAELRHHNMVLKVVIVLLILALFYNNQSWSKLATELSQKQWLVFHDTGVETNIALASDYRTGPSDPEIKHVGWDFLRWVATMDSTNVDIAISQVKPMLTKDLSTEFGKAMEPKKEEIRQLGVYKTIENGSVRQLTTLKPEELPTGIGEPTRYQLFISGTLNTFRVTTKEMIASGPFLYYVELVPIPFRTVDNPYGLLVSKFAKYDPQQAPKSPDKSAESNKAQGQPTN